MRILVTNDDGINAQGLKVLEKIARTISKDVWVVAPETEQSGAGHSLSINSPLRCRKISAKKFAVKGTPTDCVLMAANVIVKKKIDLVLSGVNRGQNIAEDITHSGTVAGAMEATLLNIPAIAFSQALDFSASKPKIHWQTAEKHAPEIIKKLLKHKWDKDTFFNVYFPNCAAEKVKGAKLVAHGKRDTSKTIVSCADPDGKPYYWIHWDDEGTHLHRPDSDIKWLYENYITITPICLDLTNYKTLKNLKEEFEK